MPFDNNMLDSLDTGVIGPVTTMPSFEAAFGKLPSALHGIVVSCILLAAAVASLFAGALSDRFGRPRAIAIGCLGFAIGAAIEAGASSLGMFMTGRCVVGVGEGLFLSTVVVYTILSSIGKLPADKSLVTSAKLRLLDFAVSWPPPYKSSSVLGSWLGTSCATVQSL